MSAWWAVMLGVALPVSALAQTSVTVTDLGPGQSGRLLQAALTRPHRVIAPDTGWFVMARGTSSNQTLVVLGRSAAIAGTVHGDVIVVDGDLYLRPGARVTGRAIAIGGGTYPSALAVIEQGALSFRDNTFAIAPVPGGYHVAYQPLREEYGAPLLFPGLYGVRLPDYDRVNGLSLPFGPALGFAAGRGQVDGLVTYRSDLGKFDPTVEASLALSRRLRAEASVGRGSFSNDDWIWSDPVNSISVIGNGKDTRNYYRADRAEATLHRLWEAVSTRNEPFVGFLAERAWSVGPAPGEQRGPWSLFNRTDSLGIRRPNPPIVPGTVTAVLLGNAMLWEAAGLALELGVRGEVSLSAPGDARFQQFTSDLEVTFPTVREQEYELEVHWVTTFGDAPPSQRFSYLGGSGTLTFLDLLEQGGDEALLVDQRYSIPLPNIRVGLLGEPTLLLRHRIGSAGLGRLPTLEQVVGVGVMLTLIRAEIQLDPASGNVRFSAGFSFSR